MDKIFNVANPSERELIAMESMVENYPKNNLIQVHSLINSNFASKTNAVPTGIVSIHPGDAIVHPDTIAADIFDVLIVCPIADPQNEITDAYFKNKKLKGIPQTSNNPPRINGIMTNGIDGDTWSAEIGTGFAGVYKQLSEDKRHSKYFVVVQAGAPTARNEIRKMVVDNKITFNELLQNRKYNFGKYISKRNATRIAYCVSQAVGVKIAPNIDGESYVSHSSIARPFRAATTSKYTQRVSSIQPISWKGESRVAVFHGAIPASRVQQKCYVNAGPYNGIAVFNIKDSMNSFALPVNTGHTEKDLKKLSKDEEIKRSNGFEWENKTDEFHDDLHPDAYKTVNNDFLKEMSQLGWKQEGLENRSLLVPVLVKISNL